MHYNIHDEKVIFGEIKFLINGKKSFLTFSLFNHLHSWKILVLQTNIDFFVPIMFWLKLSIQMLFISY